MESISEIMRRFLSSGASKQRILFGRDLADTCVDGELPLLLEKWLTIIEGCGMALLPNINYLTNYSKAHQRFLDHKTSTRESTEEAVKAIENGMQYISWSNQLIYNTIGETLKKISPSLAFDLLKAFLESHPQPLISFPAFLSAAPKIGIYLLLPIWLTSAQKKVHPLRSVKYCLTGCHYLIYHC